MVIPRCLWRKNKTPSIIHILWILKYHFPINWLTCDEELVVCFIACRHKRQRHFWTLNAGIELLLHRSSQPTSVKFQGALRPTWDGVERRCSTFFSMHVAFPWICDRAITDRLRHSVNHYSWPPSIKNSLEHLNCVATWEENDYNNFNGNYSKTVSKRSRKKQSIMKS